MLKELYQQLCRHRVTHTDDYKMIENIIVIHTLGGLSEMIKSDEAGLLFVVKPDANPNTMFISHMDMVNTAKILALRKETIDIPVDTDLDFNEIGICRNAAGENMGADDKAGVAILISMMRAGVSGYYLFTRGEESGGIGAKHFINDKANEDLISKLQKVISFDRRGTSSIITEQGGTRCCSDKFALHLASIFRLYGMFHVPDPTGSYTCSKEFIYAVPECTNISVGYMKEHTVGETLDFIYLQKLVDVCCEIDWQGLPAFKEPEVKSLPIVYPPSTYASFEDYAGRWAYDEDPVYWDAQLKKYLKIPTTKELFPDKIKPDAIATTPEPPTQPKLINSIEFMASETTLFIQPIEQIFNDALAIVAKWAHTKVKDIKGDIQYIILSQLKFEELMIRLKLFASAIDEKLAHIYARQYTVDQSPIPDYIVIASPSITDFSLEELEETEASQGGIDPVQYGITLDKPYAIYTTELFYYTY